MLKSTLTAIALAISMATFASASEHSDNSLKCRVLHRCTVQTAIAPKREHAPIRIEVVASREATIAAQSSIDPIRAASLQRAYAWCEIAHSTSGACHFSTADRIYASLPSNVYAMDQRYIS